MEYRFFSSINEHIFNTKWKTQAHAEKRSDIYFVLPILANEPDDFHLEHGLKLRNQKRVELKVRKNRSSNGEEHWQKTIHSFWKTPIDDFQSILKVLKEHREHRLIERLTSSEPIILCYVNKVRHQTSAARHLTEEITGLHLQFRRLNDQVQIGNDLFYETVCIEGPSSKGIDKEIIVNLLQRHGKTSVNPMGYAEFLFGEYQKLANE